MIQKQIDIVIPSFRLQDSFLLPLLALPKPAGWTFTYYLVVDNPAVQVPPGIRDWQEEGSTLHLLINPENLGAAASRNRGIQAGKADWILFLDDDIQADPDLLYQYTQAIEEFPEEIGFIGLTDFPPPHNPFTQALEAMYLTGIFKIAQKREFFSWGVTANMMYRRSRMGGLLFSPDFPKNGGGEDIDLPVRIVEKNKREFKCLAQARVVHPWWNHSQPHYKRFIRYGEGNGYLIEKHPKETWVDFANPSESILLVLLLTPVLLLQGEWKILLSLFLMIPLAEYLTMSLKAQYKGIRDFRTVHYMVLLKNSQEWGQLSLVFKKGTLKPFMKRIYLGFRKSSPFPVNKWKIIKIAFLLLWMTGTYLLLKQ